MPAAGNRWAYSPHVPVLFQEVLEHLRPQPGGRFIDGTVGGGGHAAGLLAATAPDGRLLALDRDPEAIACSRRSLATYGQRVTLVQAGYDQLAALAPAHGFAAVDGILLDLGLSSYQLADAERGFSFSLDGPLDMRFDPGQGQPAAELVNNLPEADLARLLRRYGEVRNHRRLASAIVKERPLESTVQLAELVARESGGRDGRRRPVHPATQVFQALRIAVNDELGSLERGLAAAVGLLKPGGRLAVISFHSLEDRLVKRFFREQSRDCTCPPEQPVCTCSAWPLLRPVTRKVIRPAAAEIAANPRSRSARLRVAEKAPIAGQ